MSFTVFPIRNEAMSLPTVETHVFVNCGCNREDFVVHQLPYSIWGYDCIVFWNNGDDAVYYCSKYGNFSNLSGGNCSHVKFTEKHKCTPWTAKDAINHLDAPLYTGEGQYLGRIMSITSTGVNISSIYMFYTYEKLLNLKFKLDGGICAYNKAQR